MYSCEPARAEEELVDEGEHRPRIARQEFLGAVPEIALAQSRYGRVDGDEEGGSARFHRAFEAGGGHVAAADEIELVPERPFRSGADFVDTAAGQGR